jgi:hypothetical protein
MDNGLGMQKAMAISSDYFAALSQLSSEYWFDVDVHGGKGIARFWTEDGVLDLEGSRAEGVVAIEDFYAERRRRGSRVSLHAISNLCASSLSADRIELHSIVTLYAADGVPPIDGAVPLGIATAADICVKDADGGWRYASRRLLSIFKGEGTPTVPRKSS